jgi:hypothetical protein
MKPAASLLAILAVLFCVRPAAAGPEDAPKPASPPAPLRVDVGVYVNRITDVSLRENRFRADFYVWFRWTGGDRDFDPLRTFDLVDGSISQRSAEVRQELKGSRYASCRCDAEVTQIFDVTRFPLDDHVLRLRIEDTEKEAEFVEYAPDVKNSGVSSETEVPGWYIVRATAAVKPHRYATNYGNEDLGGEGSTYSQFVLSVPIERHGGGYFLKLFFGLFVAVAIALIGFFVKPTDLDPRFGLPVGAIFAAVGSLYVTSQLQPDTDTISLSDRLHILAFVTILLALIESTWSLRVWTSGDEARSARIDRAAFWGLFLFYVGCSTWTSLSG